MGRIGPLVALSVLGAATGCFWVEPGAGPDRQSHNPLEDAIGVDTVASLAPVWEAPLDDGPAGDPVTSAPGVHVADTRSTYGFAATDGTRRWEHEVAAPLAVQQPIVNGDQVLASRWNPTATDTSDPGASDVVELLDAATGAVESSIDGAVAVSTRGRDVLTWGVGFVRLGRPLFPFWGEHLLVRDLDTGELACCNGTFYGLASPTNPPPAPERFTLGDRWLLQAGQGIVDPAQPGPTANGLRGIWLDESATCLGLYTCPSWVVALDGTTATHPVLSDDQLTVYVGTDAGTVYAVDLSTSTVPVLWSAPVGSAVTDAPALAGGSLYVPTADGDLVVLDAATGAARWMAAAGASLGQQPAVAGGVVFTGSTDGLLRAFDAAGCGAGVVTCGPLWSTSTGSDVTGAPAVSGGRVYVGTADGRLLAYGLP